MSGNERHSLSRKKEVIEAVIDNGFRVKQIAELYGIPCKTVYKWVNDRHRILASPQTSWNERYVPKCGPGYYPEIENIIVAWIRERRQNRIPMTKTDIMNKASVVHASQAGPMGVSTDDFKASFGWVDRFLKRSFPNENIFHYQ